MPRLTSDQIAARRNGMGATDIVEVALAPIGQVPWSDAGPIRVYARKKGLLPEPEETPEMAWGHVQEDVLLGWYAAQGFQFLPGGTLYDPTDPWLFATIDAKLIGQPINVECKHVSRWMSRDWDPSEPEGIPHHVAAQVQIGMYVTAARQCDVIADIAGEPPKIWRINYHDELAHKLVDEGRRFWFEYVIPGKHPPPDGSDACREMLRAIYPKDERPMLDADAECNAIALARIEAAKSEKWNKQAKDDKDNRLLEKIGPAKGMRGDGWQMTWKVGKDGVRRSRFTPIKGGEDAS